MKKTGKIGCAIRIDLRLVKVVLWAVAPFVAMGLVSESRAASFATRFTRYHTVLY